MIHKLFKLVATSTLILSSNLIAQTDLVAAPESIFSPLMLIIMALIVVVLGLLFYINLLSKRSKRLIDEAYREAELASKAKDTFLANVSHETRTPMNAIIGLSHILLKQGNLSHSQKTNMFKIKRSAEMLLLITNDILDFSKIEAGKLQIEEIDFESGEFFSNVADMVNVNAVEKKLDLIFDISSEIPEILRGDPLRLSQVLINLLNNAMKFTSSGEVILRVSIMHEEGSDRKILFEVIDTGIGLNEEQIEKLFKAFSQADSRVSRKYGGTGLGLAISKELVEMMGGALDVKSKPREGSNFFFTIPKKETQADEETVNKLAKRLLANKTILIVEKSNSSAKVLANILLEHDAVVKIVYDADDLARLLAWNSFDAVCIDSRIVAEIDNVDLLHDKSEAVVLLQYEVLNSPVVNKLRVNSSITKPFMYLSVMRSMAEIFSKNIVQHQLKKDRVSIEDLAVLQGSTILLVEDNDGNKMVVEGLLEGSGIEILHASNGQQAVEAVSNNGSNLELILMDINMPIMDGYAATSIIREYQRYDNIPIVAMTANITESDIEKSKSFGMQGHLSKPIDVDAFYKVLLQYIRPKVKISVDEKLKRLDDAKIDIQSLSLPGIDVMDGLARLNGNQKAYHSILLKYVDLFENVATDLSKLVTTKSFTEAASLAHNLKGLSGNIGATELYELAKEAEEVLKEGSGDSSEVISTIDSKVKELCSSITAQLGTHNSKSLPKKSIDNDEIKNILSKLYKYAKKRKALDVKKTCREMEGFEWPENYQPAIDNIVKLSASYKFDDILKSIESIASIPKG